MTDMLSNEELDNLKVGDLVTARIVIHQEKNQATIDTILLQITFIDRPPGLDTWAKTKVIKGSKRHKKGSKFSIDEGWFGIRLATPMDLLCLL